MSAFGQRVKYYTRFPSGGRVSIERYIGSGDKDWNKAVFDLSREQQADIESELGETLAWERKDDYNLSLVAAYRQGSIDDYEETLTEIRAWMVERLLKLKQVFGPRLDELVV